MRIPTLHLAPALQQHLLRLAKILGAAIVVFALFGFFAAPLIVKGYVAQRIGDEIGHKVDFGEVDINPFALSASLRNVSLYEADRRSKLLTVGEIYLNASVSSLLRLAPVITEIRLERPVVHIVRSAENRFNFSDIVDKILAQPARQDGHAYFSLHNIRLRQGRIDYDDQWRQSRHSLTEIDLALPFLSNLKHGVDIFTKPAFSGRLNGSRFSVRGQTRPFAATRDTSLQIDLDRLSLPEYMPLIPVPLNFKLKSGLLDTRLNIEFHRTGATGSIVITGQAALRKVQLQEKSGAPLLQWERLTLDLERLEPFNKLVRLTSLKLEAPMLHASRRRDGTLNLLQAFTQPSTAAKPSSATPAAAGKPMAFELAQAVITGGQVQWRDAAAGPAGPAAFDISKLDATLTSFNSEGSKPAQLSATLATAAAETVRYDGVLAADGKSLQGKIQISALQPQHLQPYFASVFAAKFGNTLLDATLPHRLAWPAGGLQLIVQDASARLRNLQITSATAATPAIAARAVELSGMRVDLAQRRFNADRLMIDGAKLDVQRNAKGGLDLSTAFAPAPNGKAAAPQPAAAKSGGWGGALGHVQVSQSELRFSDLAVAAQNGGKPALQQFSKLDLALENVGWQSGAGATSATSAPIPLSLKTSHGQRGTLSASGTLSLQPFGATLQLDARRLDVTALQPYFADRSNATFSHGTLSANGKLMLQLPQRSPQHPLQLTYAGALSLNGVRTRDRLSGDDLARWKSLSAANLDVRLNTGKNPVQLSMGDVGLTDFYARIIVKQDGRLNLQDLVATPGQGQVAPTVSLTQGTAPAAGVPATAAAPAVKRKSEPLIRIGKITLQGGNINFSDNFVKPNYSANLTGMSGSISRLASNDQTPAEVLLKGKLDRDAAVEISGKLNPLGSQLYLDLAASAHGIELTRLTPYAAKYAGYSITKGKLSADVKYHVENGRLTAQNKVFLEQLTFGDKVASPDATKLPVLLAVALLRNSRGEIDLNLPVSGSLSDPEFSVGGVLLRAIGNLLAKAVTAPFSLLASAFGGADTDQLSYIEFAAGTSRLSAEADQKLQTLAKALNDRPELKLDISGRIDPELDRDGVRQAYVERQVRRQKLEDLRDQGSAIQLRDVTVEPDEYATYLKRAYRAEKFEKPRNVIGLNKSLAPEEMEKLMIANAPIGEAELKALADRRALTVKLYLEQQGKVANERMFLVAPKLTADGIKDSDKASRVEFAITR